MKKLSKIKYLGTETQNCESRDQWKNRSKELMRHKEDLEQQIEAVKEEANRERMRAEQLQNEIETIWKKKSRT